MHPDDILVLANPGRTLNPKLLDLFRQILNRIETNDHLSNYLKAVGKLDRRVYYDEMLVHLSILHLTALEEIQRTYVDHGLLPDFERYPDLPLLLSLVQESFELTNSIEHENLLDVVFQVSSQTLEALFLLHKYNWSSAPGNILEANRRFLVCDFTKAYLNRIQSLTYPDWYVACFMNDYRNSSTWAKYADNHSGICLVFETEQKADRECLALRERADPSSNDYDRALPPMQIQDVEYGRGVVELDFFRSIGGLSKTDLMETWYQARNGEISQCGSHLASDTDEWRKSHWKNFSRLSTIKTKDWEYEQERRVVLSSVLDDLNEPESRKLKYDFSSLKGLIFGVRTSDSDKFRIIDVIEKKCQEHRRTDFDFYQAYYCRKNDDIRRYKLILQFSGPE